MDMSLTSLHSHGNRKMCTHPLLKVPVCKGCHTTYHTGEFTVCKSVSFSPPSLPPSLPSAASFSGPYFSLF